MKNGNEKIPKSHWILKLRIQAKVLAFLFPPLPPPCEKAIHNNLIIAALFFLNKTFENDL